MVLVGLFFAMKTAGVHGRHGVVGKSNRFFEIRVRCKNICSVRQRTIGSIQTSQNYDIITVLR